MCLGKARQRSGCVHCCITHATQCGLTGEHAVFTHTPIVSIRCRSVPAIRRLRMCANVRPRYSRNTFAVFQVPLRVAIRLPMPVTKITSTRMRDSARIDPVCRMPMADHRKTAVAGRPGLQALAKPPRRKCNPIRGDRIRAYADSVVALPPGDADCGATRPRRRRRNGDRCRPAARRWYRAGSRPRDRRLRRSRPAPRHRDRARATRR